MTPSTSPNPALFWASLFVEELARAGVRHVCVSPGSRSTPLVLAFSAHPGFQVYSLLDERSAAFFALGVGLASGWPAALVCTSGTAAANFFPAVVEASQAHVPMLVLTADRPPELRGSGANQTIDQVRLYGGQVRWFVDIPLPENQPAPATVRYLRSLAGRAVGAATGSPPGPVHLNFPFRKPLEPTPAVGFVPPAYTGQRPDVRPFAAVSRGVASLQADDLALLEDRVRRAERGAIVCGPRCPEGAFPAAVAALARAVGFPVFADALSGVRFGGHQPSDLFLSGYESFLPALLRHEFPPPDLVLQFGASPTSASLIEWLGNMPGDGYRFAIRPHADWQDETFTTSHLMVAEPERVCRELAARLQEGQAYSQRENWIGALQQAEERAWEAVDCAARDVFFEGLILAEVVHALPPGAALFVASSLPVRHLDQFARGRAARVRVFANRGASGIDGTISTALGVAAVEEGPLALVIGDLAFYHDLNGLLAFQRCGLSATMVLINNNGGGLFRRLPVAGFDPPFTDLFLTPHGLDFEPLARAFGVGYARADGQEAFRKLFAASIGSGIPVVIEVRTDSALHESMRQQIITNLSLTHPGFWERGETSERSQSL